MKITKEKLQDIIREEISHLIKEGFISQEQIDEGFFDNLKKGAAGVALATGLAGASPAMANEPAVGQPAAQAYDKSGKEVNVNQIKSITVSKNILQTSNDLVKNNEQTMAQYIRDVESFGGKITSVTTSFSYVTQVNGKTVTVEQIAKKGGEGGNQHILVVNDKQFDAKKYQAGNPESERQLAAFLDSLGDFAQTRTK